MRQPKPRPKDPENLYPFFKNERKYRTLSFVTGIVSTTLFLLSLREGWAPGAFLGAVLMFIGAGLALAGVLFAAHHGDAKLLAQLCLIAMWLILTPLLIMSHKLKEVGDEGPPPPASPIGTPVPSGSATGPRILPNILAVDACPTGPDDKAAAPFPLAAATVRAVPGLPEWRRHVQTSDGAAG